MSDHETLDKQETLITSFGIDDDKIYVGKADIVSLVNYANKLLDDIDPKKPFGAHFWSLDVSKNCRDFLDLIGKAFDDFYIEGTRSYDYKTCQFVWLQSVNPRRPVIPRKFYKTELRNSSLTTVMSAIIGQLRHRLSQLPFREMQSAYVIDLCAELRNILSKLPEQQDKQITIEVREDEDSDGDNYQKDGKTMKQITIKYEPFIEDLQNAFTAAKNANRIAMNKNREAREAREARTEHKQRDDNKGWQKVGKRK